MAVRFRLRAIIRPTMPGYKRMDIPALSGSAFTSQIAGVEKTWSF